MLDQQINDSNDLRTFIIEWNNRFPYDYHIRKKYHIQFGSEQHKSLNFINMAIEFAEDKILDQYEAESVDFGDVAQINGGLPGQMKTGQNQEGKEVIRMTRKEVDSEFENMDLSQFND